MWTAIPFSYLVSTPRYYFRFHLKYLVCDVIFLLVHQWLFVIIVLALMFIISYMFSILRWISLDELFQVLLLR